MSTDKMPCKTITDQRKTNKPIMEKKRRARINNCLNELKNLLLEAMRKDPLRHSKLEKADILEMTVKHLQTLQRQQTELSVVANSRVVTKYRAGYSECALEVSRYMSKADGIERGAKQRLLNHLSNCLNGLGVAMTPFAAGSNTRPASSTISALAAAVASSSAAANSTPTMATASLSPFQLIPRRLQNGGVALVLPHQANSATNWSQLTTTTTSRPFHPYFQSNAIQSNYGRTPTSVVSSSPQLSPSILAVNRSSQSTPSMSDDDDHRFNMARSPCCSGSNSSSSSTRSSSSPIFGDSQRWCQQQNGEPVNLSKESATMWRPW